MGCWREFGLIATLLPAPFLAACQTSGPSPTPRTAEPKPAAVSVGGDLAAGKLLFVVKGCVACHKAPEVPEAQGVVGPDLKGFASRPRVAGVLDNTPANIKRFIMDPTGVKPGISMPNLALTETEATNLTAFLETLK